MQSASNNRLIRRRVALGALATLLVLATSPSGRVLVMVSLVLWPVALFEAWGARSRHDSAAVHDPRAAAA